MRLLTRLLFSLAFLLAAVSSWADSYLIDGIYYNIISPQERLCEVTHNPMEKDQVHPDGTAYSGIVKVPQHIDIDGTDYTVAQVGKNAFAMCEALTYVILPDSMTVINDYAFYGCINVTSVNIPQTVQIIGEFAFRDCYYLSPIELPASLHTIGNSAFSYCTSLASICLPEKVKSIPNYLFHGCTLLQSVGMPSQLRSIGQNAFAECSMLTTIDLPEGITTIGRSAFADCAELTTISIPSTVTELGSYAFRDCVSLQEVSLPASVLTIGDYTFSGCESLVELQLAQGLRSVGAYAFSYCYELCLDSLPNAVTEIGDYAFCECLSLRDFSLPRGITTVGEGTFADCESLETVVIPSRVTTIGTEAFARCTSLTDVYNYSVFPQPIDEATFDVHPTLHVVENHGYRYAAEPVWQDCQIIEDLPYVRVNEIRMWQDTCRCECADVLMARAECLPANALYSALTWSSSDPNIIFIDSHTGQFVGVRQGTAVITARATDDSGTTASAIIVVGNGESAAPQPTRQCDTPTIAFRDGQLHFDCATFGAEYHCSIKDLDTADDLISSATLPLSGTLQIAVYATAPDYQPSTTAYATLHWLHSVPSSDDTLPVVFDASRRAICCTVTNQILSVEGLQPREAVSLYTLSGALIASHTATSAGTIQADLTDYRGQLIIIRVADDSIRLLVR